MKLLDILTFLAASGAAHAADKPSVLVITVDDLNHRVGRLGRNKQTVTPSIDPLAKLGVSLANAQCAAPPCNPSRAALLSGKRPGAAGIANQSGSCDRVTRC